MVGTHIGRRSLAICAVVLGFALIAAPASAQSGQVRGKVLDAQNKPVDGAKITILMTEGINRKFETKSKKSGEFLQIGIPPGNYTVTAEKDGLTQSFPVRIGLDMKEVNFVLKPGGAGGTMTKEEAAKATARIEGLKTAFAEGATLSNEGKYDEAIAKFNQVLVDVPACMECYLNIGSTYALKKDYEQAEVAYRKVIEMKPETTEAYNGLATIYNAQKKFKEAQEMSAEASKRAEATPGGVGNADTLYNQGVIAWNANDFPKAQEHFTAALVVNPNHAESHFMLGKVFLNLGKLPEAVKAFEAYVKVAPTGPNAKEAQANIEMLKQIK
jgi:tetratricopeptide (TPR) repeat protein